MAETKDSGKSEPFAGEMSTVFVPRDLLLPLGQTTNEAPVIERAKPIGNW